MKDITIKQEDAGGRLDKFLFRYFNKAPASTVYKLLRKKRIKLNGKRAEGSEIIVGGDTLRFYLADETLDNFMETRIIKKNDGVEVIFEDGNILLVNKPSGLLTHSSGGAGEDTLIERVLYHLYKTGSYRPEKESSFTPALCNRLDRNTSGLVICGKTLHALRNLNLAIAEELIDKYYLAAVKGRVDKPGVLKGFHEKDGKTNISRISDFEQSGSKEALTEYSPVTIGDGVSLIRIRLVTGRSHQIRVHMASIGHPVIGDTKYGDARVNGMFKQRYGVTSQLLHAEMLRFGDMPGELKYLSGKEFNAAAPKLFGLITN